MGFSKSIKAFLEATKDTEEEVFVNKTEARDDKKHKGRVKRVTLPLRFDTGMLIEDAMKFYRKRNKALSVKKGQYLKFPESNKELIEMYVLRGLAEDGFPLSDALLTHLQKFITNEEDI